MMDLGRKRVLVVADHPEMLAAPCRALQACGITNTFAVRGGHEAVKRLRNMRFDIVLADFDLGPGPDGQQLLEHCRTENLLAPDAVFVMVTAERAYERVMSAAEFFPDDYLVKPFAEDTFRSRLLRCIERRQALAHLHALKAKGRHEEMLAACDRLSAEDSRYAPEAVRLKIEALLELRRFKLACTACEQILAQRSAPWARLALARAHEGLGASEQARAALTELLADAPEYLAAYDALAQLHGRAQNDDDAKTVLRMALDVSPRVLHRHKAIGEIALRSKDLDTAESAFGALVRRGRNGFTRSSDDYLQLSRILMERNKLPEALQTLADVRKSFPESAVARVAAAAVESLVFSKAGNARESRKALTHALAATKVGEPALSKDTAMELARACYLHKQEQEGAQIVQKLVSNNHDDDGLIASVRHMFTELDRTEQGETIIERSIGDAVRINNEGVARAKNGDLEGAIALLEEAAASMPDNTHIVMNAAHSLLAHMQLHGMQADKQAKVTDYLQRVRARDPSHPKYLEVLALERQFHAPQAEQAA